jgi:glycogen synthase
MKILMTADCIGGVWSYAINLCEALGELGVETVLVTGGRPLSPDQLRHATRLPRTRIIDSAHPLEWMQDPWEALDRAGARLLRLAETENVDLVHLNDYSFGSLPWPVPTLMVAHSCVLSWYRAVRGQAAGEEWAEYRRRVSAGLSAADFLIAPTQAMLDEIRCCYGTRTPSAVIRNGIAPFPAGLSAKQAWILSVGRLWDEAKNITQLDRVAASLSWPVAVAGDCAHPENGQTELKHVTALGQLDQNALRLWYERASIYAHPARYEPFGLSVLEAASAGAALVLGDIPTLRELWDGAAVFVDPDNGPQLRSSIELLIQQPNLRSTLAMRAQIRAARFHRDAMAAATLAAYHQLLTSPSPRSTTPPRAPGAPAVALITADSAHAARNSALELPLSHVPDTGAVSPSAPLPAPLAPPLTRNH